jgi:hypothetical protein
MLHKYFNLRLFSNKTRLETKLLTLSNLKTN